MLAGLAGLTLAAGLAGLYLWQERRLKQRDTGLLRLGCRRSSRSTGSPPAPHSSRSCVLTAGIVVGLGSFERGDFDVPMAVTLAIWALYAAGLILRREMGLRGRRFARAARCSASLLVAIVLPLTHFAS